MMTHRHASVFATSLARTRRRRAAARRRTLNMTPGIMNLAPGLLDPHADVLVVRRVGMFVFGWMIYSLCAPQVGRRRSTRLVHNTRRSHLDRNRS
jgi:hypothetical protein